MEASSSPTKQIRRKSRKTIRTVTKSFTNTDSPKMMSQESFSDSATDRDDYNSETEGSQEMASSQETNSSYEEINEMPKRPFTEQSSERQATLVTSVRKCIDLLSGGDVVPMLARVLNRSEIQGLSDLILDRKDHTIYPARIKQEPRQTWMKIEPKQEEEESLVIEYDRPEPSLPSSDIDNLLAFEESLLSDVNEPPAAEDIPSTSEKAAKVLPEIPSTPVSVGSIKRPLNKGHEHLHEKRPRKTAPAVRDSKDVADKTSCRRNLGHTFATADTLFDDEVVPTNELQEDNNQPDQDEVIANLSISNESSESERDEHFASNDDVSQSVTVLTQPAKPDPEVITIESEDEFDEEEARTSPSTLEGVPEDFFKEEHDATTAEEKDNLIETQFLLDDNEEEYEEREDLSNIGKEHKFVTKFRERFHLEDHTSPESIFQSLFFLESKREKPDCLCDRSACKNHKLVWIFKSSLVASSSTEKINLGKSCMHHLSRNVIHPSTGLFQVVYNGLLKGISLPYSKQTANGHNFILSNVWPVRIKNADSLFRYRINYKEVPFQKNKIELTFQQQSKTTYNLNTKYNIIFIANTSKISEQKIDNQDKYALSFSIVDCQKLTNIGEKLQMSMLNFMAPP